jgi:nitrite reductase/ring-hydroxylating ferredoxin subunit
MNAPLEHGTLDGSIVTCAMHCAQFDVTTGQVLCGPVPTDLGPEALSPRAAARLRIVDRLMQHVRMEPIPTHKVRLESDWLWVAL